MRRDALTMYERPVLETARLRLRRPAARDTAAIVAIVGDREVATRLSRVPHPYGVADAGFFLDHVVPAEWVWAITLAEADDLIGAIALTPEGEGRAELGYWLARDRWGRGIVTEAGQAVLAYGREILGLADITSGHFADNPASGRVLAKLGFVVTGHATRPCLALGHDVPSVEMRFAAAA